MTTGETCAELSNKTVSAANGVEYVYRDAGEGGVPLVLLQHFRGNLDNWDPALIDELASSRRVVTFDNVGVGGTTGNTPHRVEQMAQDAIAFLSAMEVDQATYWGSPSAASSPRKWRTLATCVPADPARDDRRGGG
jgi:hypothetical protein